MAKLKILAILIVSYLFIATQINVNHATSLADDDDQFQLDIICLRNENLTKIHFSVQDVVGGPNATLFEIARSNISDDSPTMFGLTLVVDNVVTAEPDPSSEELGSAQGTLTSADMNTIAMAMNFNIVFTSGKYNGSSLSVAGRNPIGAQQRQQAVVGGSGVFRFTRGYAVVGIFSSRTGDDSSTYAVLEYTIYTTFCPENVDYGQELIE